MPHTLLLADDSVTIQRVIELTFADEDIRVVAVSDGDQAIAALDRTPPDIVLADVGMPGRDGYQVAEHIKRSPQLAHIPVLLLTGAFEPVDQARAAQAGCDGVLAKPFEPQQVIGRVKELLARAKEFPAALDAPFSPPPAPAIAWPSGVDEPPSSPRPEPERPVDVREDVDHYFDRLDRALANLSNKDESRPAEQSVADQIDWFSKTVSPETGAPAGTQSDLATAAAPDAAASDAGARRAEPEPAAGDSREAEPPASGSVPQAVMPPLADAFAALLSAEQALPPPERTPWPAMQPEAAAAPAEGRLTDEAIDEIVRRVLERLSDRVVRETVAGLVSDVAERLVTEEIERIRNETR